MPDKPEAKKPCMVHCGDCKHEWPLFYTPLPAENIKYFSNPVCPMCQSKKIYMGVANADRA